MNLQQILTNIFSFEHNNEAIVFYIILSLALLLGVLFTYIFFSSPALKKKRKSITELKSELETANSKFKLSEDKYSVQLSKTKRLEEEAAKVQVQVDELLQKNTSYQNEINQLQFEKESLQRILENNEKEILELKNLYKISLQENSSAVERYTLLIEERNEALNKLEDLNKILENFEKERRNSNLTFDESNKIEAEKKAVLDKLEIEKKQLKEENSKLNLLITEKEQLYLDSLKQISALKQQLSEKADNQDSAEITDVDSFSTGLGIESNNLEDEVIEAHSEDVKEEIIEFDSTENEENTAEITEAMDSKEDIQITPDLTEKSPLQEILNYLGQVNLEQRDNLKLINGIDSELEEKLFELGLYSYEQLSRLNDESINQKLCQLLQIKDKSIENDQWESQARQLLIKQKINNLTKDMNLSKLFKK
jgi:predicted flap endonuclease-1-like 5' DNA nuclease